MRNRLSFPAIALLTGSVWFPVAARGMEAERMDNVKINRFISRWERAASNELGNAQTFTSELMELLGVGRVEPSRQENHLNRRGVFERGVSLVGPNGVVSNGRVDFYLAGKLILESKQSASRDPTPFPYPLSPEQRAAIMDGGVRRGSAVRGTRGWDIMMEKAFAQAVNYARSLPADEAFPPFLLVVDVANCIDVYANFDREVGFYTPFPNGREHRLRMTGLRDPAVFGRLRTIFTDPLSLDHARETERVTAELGRKLGDLAVALEDEGHDAGTVANFLMRFICTAYLEDVRLLPAGSFTRFMDEAVNRPGTFAPRMADIWDSMTEGGPCQTFGVEVSHFGRFFEDAPIPPLKPEHLRLLAEAAHTNWGDVDVAIFGAILERALSAKERFKTGAYFTSRTVVERLILPSIIGQLRAEWNEARNVALNQLADDDIDGARRTVFEYQKRLSRATVLDPAAGSGNLLWVAYWQLKLIEEEVTAVLRDLGVYEWLERAPEYFVGPKQLFGMELNPKAAAVGSLILHLSYLQWHVRAHGNVKPPEPILRERWAVDCRDAVLAWDRTEPVLDPDGEPLTRWDGRTHKIDPATRKPVPDESARVAVVRYVNPRPADWPATEFVIANPPYIGGGRRREALGREYNDALSAAYPSIPRSADYCVFWLEKAARLARTGRLRSFAFITTSSIRQGVNRRLVQSHLDGEPMLLAKGRPPLEAGPLSIVHAVAEHAWDGDGASVKVALTAFRAGRHDGILARYKDARARGRDPDVIPFTYESGRINAGLTIGPDLAAAKPLKANATMASRGFAPAGSGFIITPAQARKMGLGKIEGLEKYIRPYRNGRDIAATPRGAMVIDLFGLSEDEVEDRFPEVHQWLLERVKPQRENNNNAALRRNWWLFGSSNPTLRKTLGELSRYIVTVQVARRRYFTFLDSGIFPDTRLVVINSADAYYLGVLSSRPHLAWADANAAKRGAGNDPVYTQGATFDTFPFPDATPAQKDRIRLWAERLDAHRKERQAAFPELTLTGLYAAFEKMRAHEDLDVTDLKMAEWGDLDGLAALHAGLDEAVAEAYGWPADLSDAEILRRLLDLNRVRAAEEANGVIRYLRPEYQEPKESSREEKRPAAALPEGEPLACRSFAMVAA